MVCYGIFWGGQYHMAEKSFYVYYCLCFAFSLQKGIIHLYLYISPDVLNPHVLFDGISKKKFRNLLNIYYLNAKGRLSKSLLDAFILTPFIVNGFMECGETFIFLK